MHNRRLFLLEVRYIIFSYSVIATVSLPMAGSGFGNVFSSRRTYTQDTPYLLVNGAVRATNDFARTVLRLQPPNFAQQYNSLPNQNRNNLRYQARPLSGEEFRVPLRNGDSGMFFNNPELPMNIDKKKEENKEEITEVKMIDDNKLLLEQIFETTTFPTDTTEYWDTTDYESTTPEDDLLRSGVPDAVAASLLGK